VKTERIDHVTVVSPDAAGAAATFSRLFGLASAPIAASPDAAASAAVTIGAARIEFRTPAESGPLADALKTGGEGMTALALEVADLDQAIQTLQHAGIRFDPQTMSGRRILLVDPRAAHGVRLALMARR
jgi:catechol 2,3-dioxygenase-like lactoylglutathione lyase family enzyme